MVPLFSMIVMRISGAIAGNPVFGKTNFPARGKACLIVALSALLFQSFDHSSFRAPESLAEYLSLIHI